MTTHFKHSEKTISFAGGGKYTVDNDIQEFIIIGVDVDNQKDYLKRTEANAAFKYKNYIVSMSTSGLNHHACRTPVCIFDKEYELVSEVNTVEEAISKINTLTGEK